MLIVLTLVCFIASAAGAISGIGGGVIIKPVLDMTGMLGTAAVSFLSGCTVLAMTAVSLGKTFLKKDIEVDTARGTPLALGAAFGGVAGKMLFSSICERTGKEEIVGLIQTMIMLVIITGTFLYLTYEERIRARNISGIWTSLLIGFLLGLQSAFLGIGGGPVNLIVLRYFFSIERKKASLNSLYIIFFSQLLSLAVTIAEGSIPDVPAIYLWVMILAGIAGGLAGSHLYRKMDAGQINRLFKAVLGVLILINIRNLFR